MPILWNTEVICIFILASFECVWREFPKFLVLHCCFISIRSQHIKTKQKKVYEKFNRNYRVSWKFLFENFDLSPCSILPYFALEHILFNVTISRLAKNIKIEFLSCACILIKYPCITLVLSWGYKESNQW